MPKKILFVCLGNICRSPTAESVFRAKSKENNLDLFFDSAGTGDYHIGENSDPRSIRHAQMRGYEMTHLARQVEVVDFERFDLIFYMDPSNYTNLLKICPEQYKSKLKNLADYCHNIKSKIIPDPYQGGEADFEYVLDLVEDAWGGFLQRYLKHF